MRVFVSVINQSNKYHFSDEISDIKCKDVKIKCFHTSYVCVLSVYSLSLSLYACLWNLRGGGESITLRDCDLICILWSCVLVVTVDNWSMPLIPAPCLSTAETVISWDVCEIHELHWEDLLEALKLTWWLLPSKEAFWDHKLNLQHSESWGSYNVCAHAQGCVQTPHKLNTHAQTDIMHKHLEGWG